MHPHCLGVLPGQFIEEESRADKGKRQQVFRSLGSVEPALTSVSKKDDVQSAEQIEEKEPKTENSDGEEKEGEEKEKEKSLIVEGKREKEKPFCQNPRKHPVKEVKKNAVVLGQQEEPKAPNEILSDESSSEEDEKKEKDESSEEDRRSMAGRGECSILADLSSIERGEASPRHESWMGVGTLHEVGTMQRFCLTMFLPESRDPERGMDHERDEQRRAYAALQLRSSELSRERDQLRTDL
uniref:Uncharacterized protein n=1 Tax=Sphaerodactylus townsendi TaxID=933632 RepID=A0ACB8GFD9_9SAUR